MAYLRIFVNVLEYIEIISNILKYYGIFFEWFF